jgi:hypothetical protein
MVFSLLRPIAGLEKPSQDNAEYINPTISIWPSPITSKTTSVGITINSTLCRVFLGQRRGARRLESIQKGGRRDGGLKMDWTKPLARA